AQPRIAGHQAQDATEAIGGDPAGTLQCAPGVLVGDRPVAQRDPAAEAPGQPPRGGTGGVAGGHLLRCHRPPLAHPTPLSPLPPTLSPPALAARRTRVPRS